MVIAKPGLDGHDRGAKIIARALRDAGMEVIYTGLHQTPEQIVETAIQEDADAVGISILSGAHMTLVPRIVEGLRAHEADDVLVVVGGTIPADDAAELSAGGVAAIFTPGRADGRDRRLPPLGRRRRVAPRARSRPRPSRRLLTRGGCDRRRARRRARSITLERRLRRAREDDQAASRSGVLSVALVGATIWAATDWSRSASVGHCELDRAGRDRRPGAAGPDADGGHRRARACPRRPRPGCPSARA